MTQSVHASAPSLASSGSSGVPSNERDIGEVDHRLRAAIAQQDWRTAVSLVGAHWSALLDEPRERLDHALRAIPLEAFELDSRAAAVRDIRLHTSSDAVDRMIGDVAVPDANDLATLEALARSERALSLLGVVSSRMIALRVRGRLARATQLAELVERFGRIAAVHQPALVSARLPAALLQAGITRGLADDIPGALISLRDAYERASDSPAEYIERDAAGKSAFFLALAGDIELAQCWLARHDEAAAVEGWFGPRITLTADVARSLIAIEGLQRDAAESVLRRLEQPVNAEQSWGPGVTFAQARHALVWGDRLTTIDRVQSDRRRYADWLGESSVLGPLLAQAEGELLLSVGQSQRARQAIGSDRSQPAVAVAEARIELVGGAFDRAARHAASALGKRLSTRNRTDALAILAVAQLHLSEPDAAVQTAAHLSDSLQASGLRLAGLSIEREDRARLGLEPLDDGHGAREPFAIDDQRIRITRQQAVVLQGLEKGWSLREIATHEHLSLNTMKTHARGLYQRLGVTNRDEAIARAYEAGLL
ncbi:LuxR C-terminal-related transcriptional regulator [Microbacterium sp. W4I20]|uniref:helix-turn-helix transcriptional regulator n=1 Tax=Microbacterium sp. W4I20 TaxID=3042262 RepID=UPI00277F1FAB|nr:LuxR C-terminal-related transcriptional regulator [Microbacterium sp. W4I20]MDQ0727813.1 DNA-binding NarL/FixJ family response regulator [Microbacterium sp. W4I20]